MLSNLSEKAVCLANLLANEEGVLPEVLIETLLEKEDRARHIIHPPFEEERRTRCPLNACEEPDTRPKEHYEL